ncbi:MAG: branched-chain amino acid aminotransferase [bacterium]
MVEINYQTVDNTAKIEIPEKLIFGKVFTTHVFEMDYDAALGWYNPTIKKFSNLSLSPGALVLHYGQAIFEGLKAYKQVNGQIAMFRPDKNLERLNNSARRVCIPEIDVEFVLEALKELIKIDKDWIPTKPGYSLYIRPLVFATDPMLGVRPADQYKFIIMLCPVGPYYPEGFKPVPIMVTDKYVRAVRKGVGDCKTAGNYAASLMAQRDARNEGYTQVLWLDAIELKYIEEVGTMNIFIRFKDEVATPTLSGSILPGVTRLSVLQLLRDWKYNINERLISLKEVVDSYDKGELIEIFGTGTAAVISSVSKLKYNDKILQFSDTDAGELGTKLYQAITDIQYGRTEDPYGWMTIVQ